MGLPNGGGVPLGGARHLGSNQVELREERIIRLAAVQLEPNGLSQPDADDHLLVVDVVAGTAWRIPMNIRSMATLRGQLERALHMDPETT